jgi:hypothetical protein
MHTIYFSRQKFALFTPVARLAPKFVLAHARSSAERMQAQARRGANNLDLGFPRHAWRRPTRRYIGQSLQTGQAVFSANERRKIFYDNHKIYIDIQEQALYNSFKRHRRALGL